MLGLALLLLLGAVVAVVLMALSIALDCVRPPRHTVGYAVAWGLPADPGEAKRPFESWTLDRPGGGGGVRLPVWSIDTGAGGDLTVVMVHGWGRSRIDVLGDRLAPFDELAGRLVIYDRRGHGDATGVCRLGAGEDEDLLALLDTLGPCPVVLAGHGMGAVIAIGAAVQAGSRVGAVVAYAPYTDFHAWLRRRLALRRLPTRPLTDLALLGLAISGIRPPRVLPAVRRLACPLLVVHGADDRLSPVEQGRVIAEAAPHGELLVVEGAGHLDVHRVGGERHDEAVRRLLAGGIDLRLEI